VLGCTPRQDSESETVARCTHDLHALGSAQLGLGPYADNYWDLTISDGRIVANDWIWTTSNGFADEVWEPVKAWLYEHHPDEVDAMYIGSHDAFALTDTSARLWDRITREYVASRLEAPR
jgi:hypothetical protein